jgi:hypothetical protein
MFVLVLIINMPIFAFQILSGKPKRLLVGKSVYKDLLPYFEGAYHGDLSWFKFARVRYLSVILLTYHAQSNLNALNTYFNISSLKYLVANPLDSDFIDRRDKFIKNVEIFDKVVSNTYKFGVFVVGGPIIAVLSLVAQHVILPITAQLWAWVSGVSLSTEQISEAEIFTLCFAVISVWIMVSAWIDMRSIILRNDLYTFERNIFSESGIKYHRPFPYDIFLYLSYLLLAIYTAYEILIINYTHTLRPYILNNSKEMTLYWAILALIPLGVGVIAVVRRYTIPSNHRALPPH